MNHDACVQLAWDQQVAEDATATCGPTTPGSSGPQQQEPEGLIPQAQSIPEENGEENREGMEKKKPNLKMGGFDDTTVGNYIAPRPVQYALRHIEDFEYIELWYLTPEGCSNATQLTRHDEAFGLAKVDDLI